MDGHPMPVIDLLVDATVGHKVIGFIDGNVGYNQIFMVEDVSKIAFSWARWLVWMDCHDLWD